MNDQRRSKRRILAVIGLVFVALSIAMTFLAPSTFWNYGLLLIALAFVVTVHGGIQIYHRIRKPNRCALYQRKRPKRPILGEKCKEFRSWIAFQSHPHPVNGYLLCFYRGVPPEILVHFYY